MGGSCFFIDKTLNTEAAGAIATIVVNDVPGAAVEMGSPVPGIVGTGPSIMISLSDGTTLIACARNKSRYNTYHWNANVSIDSNVEFLHRGLFS